MKHTYDLAHERDLALFVTQHFSHLAERIRLTLFEAQEPLIARNEPLAAVVAVEAVVSHAVAIGNHPHLVLSVASKACGVPILRAASMGAAEPLAVQGTTATTADMTTSAPDEFLSRVKEETAVAVAVVDRTHKYQTVPGAHGEKIRIVRAGDVAGRVIQVLTDYEPLADVMAHLGDEQTFALFGRLSTEIAKMITQGLQ